MTSPKHDLLSLALEDLRNRPSSTRPRLRARLGAIEPPRTSHAATALSLDWRSRGDRHRGLSGLPSAHRRRSSCVSVYGTEIGRTRTSARSKTAHASCWIRAPRVRVALLETARETWNCSKARRISMSPRSRSPLRVRTRLRRSSAVGTSFDVAARPGVRR